MPFKTPGSHSLRTRFFQDWGTCFDGIHRPKHLRWVEEVGEQFCHPGVGGEPKWPVFRDAGSSSKHQFFRDYVSFQGWYMYWLVSTAGDFCLLRVSRVGCIDGQICDSPNECIHCQMLVIDAHCCNRGILFCFSFTSVRCQFFAMLWGVLHHNLTLSCCITTWLDPKAHCSNSDGNWPILSHGFKWSTGLKWSEVVQFLTREFPPGPELE